MLPKSSKGSVIHRESNVPDTIANELQLLGVVILSRVIFSGHIYPSYQIETAVMWMQREM